MKRCGKSRCQICKFGKEERSFRNNLDNREFYVNYDFDCATCIQMYAHFFEDGHRGSDDVRVIVMIIDKTDVSKPVEREGFWVYKLNSLVPHGLNLNDLYKRL